MGRVPLGVGHVEVFVVEGFTERDPGFEDSPISGGVLDDKIVLLVV